MKRNIFWAIFSCVFVIYNSIMFCLELDRGKFVWAGIFLGFALLNSGMFILWTKKTGDNYGDK